MGEPDALLTLAEIALGLAGFTGVIVVFGRDPKAPWHQLDRYRVTRMLSASIAALFFSLLPEGLYATGLSSAFTWRLASALLLAYAILSGRNMVLQFRALDSAARGQFNLKYIPALFALFFIVVLSQALNVVGLWWPPGYAAYYWGVVWLLAFGVFQFVRIVFVRPGSP